MVSRVSCRPRGVPVSSQLPKPRVVPAVAPLVALWAVGTLVATLAAPVYLAASTSPALEALSEDPTAWTLSTLAGLLLVVGVVAGTWSRAGWRALRGVLLSGAIAGGFGVTAFGTYVYWFSSATLASGDGAPAIGERAPDFEITDPKGRVRSLDAYAGKTLLLVFYRGHW